MAPLSKTGLMVIVALVCAGCAGRVNIFDRVAADTSIVTGSIGSVTDESVIRDMIAGLDGSAPLDGPVEWENPATGSRGTITGVVATEVDDMRCRRFAASRERFDGVTSHRGVACETGTGWTLEEFETL